MCNKTPNIFSIVCMPVTALISGWERNYYIFSMCRYAQSCAFISVIELPRIPAYCPKIRHYVAERSTFDDDTSYIIPGKCPGDTVAIGAALPFIKEFIDGIYLI